MSLQPAEVPQPGTEYVSDSLGLNNIINTRVNTLLAEEQVTIVLTKLTIPLQQHIATINTTGTVTIRPAKELNSVLIDGCGQYRGFVVLSGNVYLTGLRVWRATQASTGCLWSAEIATNQRGHMIPLWQ